MQQNLVSINANEFSSKFNSKKEVSTFAFVDNPCFPIGLSVPELRSEGVPPGLSYGLDIPFTRPGHESATHHQMR